MTRFILSYLLVLVFVVAPSVAARAAVNSKRPSAAAPTALATTSSKLHRASHAIAHELKKSAALTDTEVAQVAAKMKNVAQRTRKVLNNHLARLTAYWSGEGDYYTRHHISATGIHLHNGHCAVDPSIIPYGSVVQIEGLGSYVAVDTGTAVVSRRAARESGHNRGERSALVIDLYFENRREGERFAANGPKFASITWTKPGSTDTAADTDTPSTFIASGDDRPRSKTL